MIGIKAALLKWAAGALLVAAVAFVSFQWGQARAEAKAEQRRREAVTEAVRAANEQARVAQREMEKRAQKLRERLSEAQTTLREKDRALAEYQGSEELCFDSPSLELFNSY